MSKASTLPTLFIGHGSPMNIVADNIWTRTMRDLGKSLSRPRAILAISAHWQTAGTQIQSATQPKMIYDFAGFPEDLYKVKYPAPGSPFLARDVQALLGTDSLLVEDWGLDHGTWAVLCHLFPAADIPVVQLSLDRRFTPQQHYDLARKLQPLRENEILILGSGNIVHNLRQIQWQEDAPAYDWAVEFDQRIATALSANDHTAVINFGQNWPALAALAHPTIEHFLPLLYVMNENAEVSFPFIGMQNASISMRAVIFD